MSATLQDSEAKQDYELVHLIELKPPPEGGTYTCSECGMVFHSKSSGWTLDRRWHVRNASTGKYRACRASD